MANHKKLLRLKNLGLTHAQIAQSCECGRNTVFSKHYADYVHKTKATIQRTGTVREHIAVPPRTV